jgi:Uma2 family endonuclease
MKEETSTVAQPYMSEAEYIAFEEQSAIRHELINNQLIAMPGTTDKHNDICFNIKSILKHLLKNLKVYTENVKVQISSDKDYSYPDVMVVTDARDFDNRYIKKYPPVIFEVMSKTSRTDDAVDKFIRYKNIESLQNYILVDSEKALVEVRVKMPEGHWESNTYLANDLAFPVPALGIELPLDGVYEDVF